MQLYHLSLNLDTVYTTSNGNTIQPVEEETTTMGETASTALSSSTAATVMDVKQGAKTEATVKNQCVSKIYDRQSDYLDNDSEAALLHALVYIYMSLERQSALLVAMTENPCHQKIQTHTLFLIK